MGITRELELDGQDGSWHLCMTGQEPTSRKTAGKWSKFRQWFLDILLRRAKTSKIRAIDSAACGPLRKHHF
jgi:hypothetical protein